MYVYVSRYIYGEIQRLTRNRDRDRLTDRWRDRASVSFNCDILQGHSQSRSAKNSTQN